MKTKEQLVNFQKKKRKEKTLMLGKIEGRRRRGWQRMSWLDGITDSMDMSLSNSRRWWRTGKPGVLQSIGSQRVRLDLGTNWTATMETELDRKGSKASVPNFSRGGQQGTSWECQRSHICALDLSCFIEQPITLNGRSSCSSLYLFWSVFP